MNKQFVVIFRIQGEESPTPYTQIIEATDFEKAEDKVETDNPGADILWMHEGTNTDLAIQEYWDSASQSKEEKELVYEFSVKLIGKGPTEGQAWADAIDCFCQDPGEPQSTEELK